jgi:hypothetical protein
VGLRAWGLAIDYGTSFTAAAVWHAGGVEVLEIEDSPRFPSAVLLGDDGALLTGRAARNQARRHPDRFERTPKRLVGQPAALLGGRAVEVTAMVAAVLGRVVEAARTREGESAPAWVLLTHPAGWGPERCDVLRAAAARAGLEPVELMSEPEAAAWFFVEDRRGEEPIVGEGGCVAVYDLGGGTFDTAILRRGPDGFRLAGPPGGLDWFGGEEFDQRLFDLVLERVHDSHPAVWRELSEPRSPGWRRARLQLREDVRQAKEALSATPTVAVPVAAGGEDVLDVPVARLDFERLIRDELAGTVDLLARTAGAAGVSHDEIAAVYLTGGSSRVPLAGDLAARFHPRTYTRPDPKSLVVRGAIAGRRAARAQAAASAEPAVPGAAPASEEPEAPSREVRLRTAGAQLADRLVRDGRPTPLGIAAGVLVLIVLAVVVRALGGGSSEPAIGAVRAELVSGRAGFARVSGTVEPADSRVRVAGRRVRVRDGRWRATVRVPTSERVRVAATAPDGEGGATKTVEVKGPRLDGTWIVTQDDVFASRVFGQPARGVRVPWRFRAICRGGRCDAAQLTFPAPGGSTEVRLRRRGAVYSGTRRYTLRGSGVCQGRRYTSRWTTSIRVTVTAWRGSRLEATRFEGLARHRTRPPASVPCSGGRLVTQLAGRPT